jgi:hypothetical protein
MQARTEKYVKGTAKGMLMYRGRAIQPVIDINVKPGTIEQGNWRIAESSSYVLLLRQLRGCVDPTNDFPRINLPVWNHFGHCLLCQFREDLFAIVHVSPTLLYQRPQVVKELHRHTSILRNRKLSTYRLLAIDTLVLSVFSSKPCRQDVSTTVPMSGLAHFTSCKAWQYL